MWLLGIGVIFAFYYNIVLLQPILWTLLGVLFSYVALYPPKVKVVKALVFLLGPHERLVDSDELYETDENATTFHIFVQAVLRFFRILIRVVFYAVVPSAGTTASSVYFSLLFRLMFVHFYTKTILTYFPHMNLLFLKVFFTLSVCGISLMFLNSLRRHVLLSKRRHMKRESNDDVPRSWTQTLFKTQDKLELLFDWFRKILAKIVLPNAHFIAALIVIACALIVISTIGVWTVYAFSDELVYLYRNIANLVRMINHYLSGFSAYTHYVDKAYAAASDYVTSSVLADSASAKTRDLYDFIAYIVSHQSDLIKSASAAVVTTDQVVPLSIAATTAAYNALAHCNTTLVAICKLNAVKFGNVSNLSNATRAIVATVNQDLESFMADPYSILNGFWEITDYYQDELKSGGTISKGGDYLLVGLNYMKDLIVQSGTISMTAIGSGVSVFTFLFDSALQALVYLTALFLLLQSNVGFYHYTAVLLHFIDPSTMLYRSIHRALRAILISSIKMAVFHASLAWLLYSVLDFPLVCIPTIVAFILGLVPVIDPVIVSAIPLPIWAYATGQSVVAIVVLAICFVVWWSVGSAIYAEIPDSSVWMTTFSVGLGISLFGARGVIIGPTIATIPFALYGLGNQYISSESLDARDNSSGVPAGFVDTLTTSMKLRESMIGDRSLSHQPPTVRRKKKKAEKRPQRMNSGDSLGRILNTSRGGATSSTNSSPVSMEKLIRGSGNPGNAETDRDRLFDYIMSTPKTGKSKRQTNIQS